MATTSSKKRRGRPAGSKNKTSAKSTSTPKRTKHDFELAQEIKAIIVFAIAILLFACNFGWIGKFGNVVSDVMFGLFGLLAYVFPLLAAFLTVYLQINQGNPGAIKKSIFGSIMFFAVGVIFDLIGGISEKAEKFDFGRFYQYCSTERKGGGVFSASASYGLLYAISKVGTIIFVIVVIIVCIIIITEKSFVKRMKAGTEILLERSANDKEFKQQIYDDRLSELKRKREIKAIRMAEKEREREERLREKEEREREANEKRNIKNEIKEDEKVLKNNRKVVSNVPENITEMTRLTPAAEDPSSVNDNIHEIKLNGFDESTLTFKPASTPVPGAGEMVEILTDDVEEPVDEVTEIKPIVTKDRPSARKTSKVEESPFAAETAVKSGEYVFPPMKLLSPGQSKSRDSESYFNGMKKKLTETLKTFGVEAEIDNYCVGPSVTRFEVIPKLGVKVSRIKSLSDDIKLSLATTDIRIEAPIPGKSAVGIEIPNRVSQPVVLRDLIDNEEFREFDSNLAFAVGKDISGKIILYDIDKFPHVLIAGATGSGKSVCINTLIMSILYKAHPDDVKLIMIDPKVVELSVYNGIPHLLLPVVTDAKKAAATLNYAVSEMMERYKKFADLGARDLAGYNRTVEQREEESEIYKKLPQIVIIVDELADLIMVAKNDVEDAICRLAQLARAAGIHLIIATQRPSVDVITGLIKANMPSRIAFAVSSGIDSRTILDSSGAEELLGKGDMLFFPKGLKNPVRLQGGFVSDAEVNSVVDFLKAQGTVSYDENINEKINSLSAQSKSSSGEEGEDGEYDDRFIEVGRYIIECQKASIGQVQRKFKMGFNRAARIVDQLCEAGVVGPDEGTKPRTVNMSMEQFENFIENEM